ncbi:MAG: hypothetical protein ACE5D4_09705, partial [Thermodesulfobacteriota bacterium]
IMRHIGYNYYHNMEPWTLDALVNRLAMPLEPVQEIITTLEQRGLIIENGSDAPNYIPGRDLGTISLKELFDAVRLAEDESMTGERLLPYEEVEGVMEGVDSAIKDALGEQCLRSLILSHGEEETVKESTTSK